MPTKSFAVDFSTSGFRRASSQMSQVGDSAEDAGDKMDRAGDEAQQAGDDIDSMGKSASSATGNFRTLGSSMRSMGSQLTMFVTAPLAAAAGGALKLASDTEEMQAKMQTVFGAATEDVKAWAATTGEELNRSALSLQEYATSLQDTFVPMGVARDEATEMSKTVAQLGIDLASFNNMAEDEALQKLKSGLVGNHRALREFGSAITQSRLEQELLNRGIEGGVQQASEQAKMMARLALLQRDTADAQGDAARTADSFANRMRGLKGQAAAVGVEIGERLLPLGQTLLGWGKDMVDAWNGLSGSTKAYAVAAGVAAAAVPPLVYALGTIPPIFAAITGAATTAWAAVTSPITGVIAAVAAVAAVVGVVYDSWSAIGSFFSGILDGVLQVVTIFGRQMKTRFALVWEQVKNLFGRAINGLISQINRGLEALGAGDYTIDTEVGVSSEGVAANRSRLQKLQEDMNAATEQANQNLSQNFDAMVGSVRDSVTDAFSYVSGFAGQVEQFFTPEQQGSSTGGSSSSGGSGSSGSSSSGSGSSSSGGSGGGFKILDFISKLEPAKKKTKQLGTVAKATTDAVAGGFNRISNSVGGAISKLVQGKDAAINFGRTLVSALGDVIKQLVAVAAKLAVVAAIKAAAGISSGGITTIGGALGAAFFADGGIVTGPTLSVIGEGRQDEAVLPLSKLESMLSLPAMAAQQASPRAPAAAGASGLSVDVHVEGRTRTSGRDIVTTYEGEKRAQATRGRK